MIWFFELFYLSLDIEIKIKVMKNKVWNKVVIATEEQNVEIYPTETFNGIIVETKELDDKTGNSRLYLNKDEMELLIIKMQEMMMYVLWLNGNS